MPFSAVRVVSALPRRRAYDTCSPPPDVPKPDFGVVHHESLDAVRAVLAIKDWTVQYSKNGIEIAVHACPTSDMHMIRSQVLVPLPVERTHAHYKVRQVTRAWIARLADVALAAHAKLDALYTRCHVHGG